MDPGGSRPPPGSPLGPRHNGISNSHARDDYKAEPEEKEQSNRSYLSPPHTLPPPPSHTTASTEYTRHAPGRHSLAPPRGSGYNPQMASSRYSERSDSAGRLSNSSLYSHNTMNGVPPPLPSPSGSLRGGDDGVATGSLRTRSNRSELLGLMSAMSMPVSPPTAGHMSAIGSPPQGQPLSAIGGSPPLSAAARLTLLEQQRRRVGLGSPDDQKDNDILSEKLLDEAYRAQLQHERDKLAQERHHEMELLRVARQELEEAEARYQRELKERNAKKTGAAAAQRSGAGRLTPVPVAPRRVVPPAPPEPSRALDRQTNMSPAEKKIEEEKELRALRGKLDDEMNKLKQDRDLLMCERDEIRNSRSQADKDSSYLTSKSDQQQAELLRTLNRIHKLRQDNVTLETDKRGNEREKGIIATQQRNLALEKHDVKKRNLILMKMKVQFQKVAEANQALKSSDADLEARIMDIRDQSDRLANYIENRDMWTVGSKVLVFSMSQKKWHEGIVYTLKNDGRKLVIQYELDNGDINQKELDRHHKHLGPINIDRSCILQKSLSLSSLGSGMLDRPMSPTGSVRSMSSAGSAMSFKVGAVGHVGAGFTLPSTPRNGLNGATEDWDTQSINSVLSEDPALTKILDLDKINSLLTESTKAVESFRADPYGTPSLSTPPPKPTAPT